MITHRNIEIPADELARLCQRYHVRELALFGSVLRDDFDEESDLDILVEFEPDSGIGLFEYVGLQQELAQLFGRQVDLVEKAGLKQLIRQSILDSAEVLYAE